MGECYKTGFNPIRLTSDSKCFHAWPGGTSDAKVGGNCASTMKPAVEAATKGYSQLLWLFGEDNEVMEVGAMNVFFYFVNKETN